MHWNSIMKKPIGPPRNPERSSGPRPPSLEIDALEFDHEEGNRPA